MTDPSIPLISSYVVVFERCEQGYCAHIPDVPGVGAVGKTLEQTQSLIREALMNQVITLKQKDGEEISPPVSFAQYLKIPTSQENWADRPNSWKFVQVLNG